MILQNTDQVPSDTNNLQANVVESGSAVVAASDWVTTGTTIGASPARTAYYMTKTVTLKTSSKQIPFVYAWYSQTNSANSYVAFNQIIDWENPYVKWGRWWYTLSGTTSNGRSVLNLNFYAVEESGNFSNGITIYYRVVSAAATEVSGL